MRTDAEGREYLTKGEYRRAMRGIYGSVPDLERGETWDMWFEAYFETLLETGEAVKVGRGYRVYE